MTTKNTTTKAAPKRRVTAKKTSTAKKATAAKAFAFWPVGSSPFHVHGQSTREGGLITVAALIAANMAKLNKTGLAPTTGTGNVKLFKALVGERPYSYHKKHGRFNANNTLTSVGAEWFGGRIKTEDDHILVDAAATAIAKGGKVDGLAVEFNREIATA